MEHLATPSKLRTTGQWALLVMAAMVGTACTGLTESNPTPNRYGSISVRARANSATGATATASAIFFEAFTAAVPNSALQRDDRCEFAAVDTTTPVTRGVKRAGAQLTLAIGGRSVAMPFDAGNLRYSSAGTSFAYTAGETVQAAVPGEDLTFPAATIGVLLAEPLIPGPVSVPAANDPMIFTWNASADTSSAIIVSLRYANPSTSTYANEQIYCSLKDDGTHQISATSLQAFRASPSNRRSLVITRWRTRETLLDARTLLHIATSVDTALVIQP